MESPKRSDIFKSISGNITFNVATKLWEQGREVEREELLGDFYGVGILVTHPEKPEASILTTIESDGKEFAIEGSIDSSDEFLYDNDQVFRAQVNLLKGRWRVVIASSAIFRLSLKPLRRRAKRVRRCFEFNFG